MSDDDENEAPAWVVNCVVAVLLWCLASGVFTFGYAVVLLARRLVG